MTDGKDVDKLIGEVKAAEIRIDQLQWQVANAGQWRAEKLRALRDLMPVAEIAERLGRTRQAVYAAMQEDPPPPLANLKKSEEDLAIGRAVRRVEAARKSLEKVGGSAATTEMGEAWGEYVKALRSAGRPVPNTVPGGVERTEELDPNELPDLIERIGVMAGQLQRIADGKVPMLVPNPVGMQMLADNMRWALDWLRTLRPAPMDVDTNGLVGRGKQWAVHPENDGEQFKGTPPTR